jgi:hypothetical protein
MIAIEPADTQPADTSQASLLLAAEHWKAIEATCMSCLLLLACKLGSSTRPAATAAA